MSTQTEIQRAIELAATKHGGLAGLAKWLGVAGSLPSMWKARGRVPPIYCPALEFAGDAQVKCEGMCPEVRWFRIADPEWPARAGGRPLIDTGRNSIRLNQQDSPEHAA